MGIFCSFRPAWIASLFLLVTFLFAACTSKDTQFDWDEYKLVVQSKRVSTYKISRLAPDEPIIIDFISAPHRNTENLKPKDFLQLHEANIESTSWTAPHQLSIYPAEPWKPGQQIKLGINLDKLFILEADEPQLIYMQGYALPLEPRLTGLTMEIDENNHTLYNITGTVKTQFPVDPEIISKLTALSLDNRKLILEWETNPGDASYVFRALDLARHTDRNQEVTASINWESEFENVMAAETLTIPPAEVFQLVRISRNPENERHFTLLFSHNLDAEQDLTGLIYWNHAEENSRLTRKNNVVELLVLTEINTDGAVVIHPGLRAERGIALQEMVSMPFEANFLHPELKTISDGVIMPVAGGFKYPFRARGLSHVYLSIYEVHDNNLLQFLQNNELADNREMERVGKVISQQVIDLNSINPGADFTKLHAYTLDLNDFIKPVSGRVYRLEIGFTRSFAIMNCSSTFPLEAALNDEIANAAQFNWNDYFGIYGYYNNYRWSHRDNPCFPAFYNSERFLSGNFLSSDVGIIAKSTNDKDFSFAITNLSTSRPIQNATVELYNFQQQKIATSNSNRDGFVNFNRLTESPAFVIVESNKERGIMKLNHTSAIPLSKFDTGGKSQASGDFFVYGERGVWRPGDTIFLNVIYRMYRQSPPAGFPMEVKLTNARGSHYTTLHSNNHVGGIYHFAIPTSHADPTGVWQAQFIAGLASHTHNLRIENVKPNRMKLEMDIDGEKLAASTTGIKGSIEAQWLHGAPAKSMEAVVELRLRSNDIEFGDFVFQDPSRKVPDQSFNIKAGKTNDAGSASFVIPEDNLNNLPGKVTLLMQARVMEQGGDYSFGNFSSEYSPYNSYTGLKLPRSTWGSYFLPIEREGIIELKSIAPDGKAQAGSKLQLSIFQLSHSWWYDYSDDYLQRYTAAGGVTPIQQFSVETNQQGLAEVNTAVLNYGRYYARVCDQESGHCSGLLFFGGDRMPQADESDGVVMLSLDADKEKYKPGDKAVIRFQGSNGGRAFVSIEQGNKQLKQEWVETSAGEQSYTFQIKPDMVPNVYVSVTLLQPYNQSGNDLPMRMFGTVPVMVEDPGNVLKPVITMQDKLRPEQAYQVSVKEASGKPMTYTLAVVDEGLLNLTNHKTPDPYKGFYAKQALGVTTYDLYNQVISRLPGSLLSMLRMGGSDAVQPEAARRAMRFKPVVTHLGPFNLESGKEAKHSIDMPAYIGAVRVMVVAAHENAYGSTEKLATVSNPVMVLGTLPRQLGPGDRLSIPVTIFTDNDRAGNIELSMQSDPHIRFTGSNKQSINMNGKREHIAYIPVEILQQEGIAQVSITATDGRTRANYKTEIQIENPAAVIRDVQLVAMQPGESITLNTPIRGNPENASVSLEISDFGAFGFERRVADLIQYPHGCLEQVTSAAFPQLFADVFRTLTPAEATEIQSNIQAAIQTLRQFQQPQGSFAYWPGGGTSNNWSDVYAFHFLTEAESKGYSVPASLKNAWISHHKSMANRWRFDTSSDAGLSSTMVQAYRLLVLALAGEPQFGPMNRMRQTQGLPANVVWRLAAAYGAAGQQEVAATMLRNTKPYVQRERSMWHHFASPLREDALMAESLIRAGMVNAAGTKITDIMQTLASEDWISTQEAAYAMYSISLFVRAQPASKSPTKAEVVWGSNSQPLTLQSEDPLIAITTQPERTGNFPVDIRNQSDKVIFVSLTGTGKPIRNSLPAASNEMKLDIVYTRPDGSAVNIGQITQGEYFYANVSIQNTSNRQLENLALEQIVPAGWEIMNPRMQPEGSNAIAQMSYQDVRDDRVFSYFNALNPGQEIKFTIQFLAAYQGNYWIPPTQIYPMYDETRFARTPGREVSVVSSTFNPGL